MDNFIKPAFTKANLDTYYIRYSVFESLTKNLKYFKGNLLDVGCGKMPYKHYILQNSEVTEYTGLDIETSIDYNGVKPDCIWDGKKMDFNDETFDTVMATEVLEHCFEPHKILEEINRVLKKDGLFFFTAPFLWPLHEVPNDACRYSPWMLRHHLEKAGFVEINVEATGGWHASMAQMIGLWVARADMSSFKRKLFASFAKGFMKCLLKAEKRINNTEFTEGQMITGVFGTAKKDA